MKFFWKLQIFVVIKDELELLRNKEESNQSDTNYSSSSGLDASRTEVTSVVLNVSSTKYKTKQWIND